MSRHRLFIASILLCGGLSLGACTKAGNPDTSLAQQAHTPDAAAEARPPGALPSDLDLHAPPPPPNHDGGRTRDAGTGIDSAVPFARGTRQGRISDDDDGDAWQLTGHDAPYLGLRVESLNGDTPLRIRLIDHQQRPVAAPILALLAPGGTLELSLELATLPDVHALLLLIEAETPADYRITLHPH